MISSKLYQIVVMRTDDGCYVLSCNDLSGGDKSCVKNTLADVVKEIENLLYAWVDSPPTLQERIDKLVADGLLPKEDKEDKNEASNS